MKASILISTTESIEGMKIEKYIDFISTNVVLGTNVFSDIGASFSDFFGGTSDIYQNKLDRIYKAGIDKLKQKAQSLGANGIIGLRIDFDEISGKGKSMFMVSASGMAVKLLQNENTNKSFNYSGSKNVSPEDLDIQISKIKISKKLKNKENPTIEDFDFLLEFPLEEIINDLLEVYLTIFKTGPWASNEYQKSIRNFLPVYLKNLDEEISSKALYGRINENPEIISILLKESQSFSPEKTLELLERYDIHYAILTLDSSKKIYQSEDLTKMKMIIQRIDNLPNTGKIESIKSLLGSEKEKFICENNHKNESNIEFCENCGKNIKGLVKSEVDKLKEFQIKIDGLSMILE